jgi:hypothetical protein
LAEVRENIAYLSQLKSDGRIDRTWAESLIFDQRALNDSLVDEAKLLAAGEANMEHVIRIEGGLPSLPGTEIIMPVLAPEQTVFPPAREDVISADVQADAPPVAAT